MAFEKLKDALDNKFDSWELYYERERVKKFESNERQIYGIEFKEEEGIACRALLEGKLFFGYTYDIPSAHETILENAEQLLRFLPEDHERRFANASRTYPVLSTYDDDGLAIADEEKSEMVITLESEIRSFDRRITAVRSCELYETETFVGITNSNGLECEASRTLFSFSAYCVAKDGDEEASWSDWSWSNHLRKINRGSFAKDIAGKTISFLFGKPIPTGVYEGVLAPQAVCELMGILSESFLAENLHKEKTRLKGKEGKTCFSDVLTIIDSGMAGTDAFPFDGEGVPSRENIVVRNGTFETFLFDTYYASKHGVSSTANEVRPTLMELPKCGIRSAYVKTGSRDVTEELTNGIIVEELMGAHTANPITGDFSLGAAGYIRKDGKSTPFQGVIFSGNIFDVLNKVKEAGNDFRFYGTFGAPSLFVEDLKISGT